MGIAGAASLFYWMLPVFSQNKQKEGGN